MYFGNEAINSIIEVVFEVPNSSAIKGTILEEAVFSEVVNGYIYMKNNLKVLVQDYHSSSQGNEMSGHNCRLKIMKPEDCKGIEIKIDKNGNTSFLSKDKDPRPYKPDIKKKIQPAIEFTDKNGKELFTVWNVWKNQGKQNKLLDKIMSDSDSYNKAEFTTGSDSNKIKYPKKENDNG